MKFTLNIVALPLLSLLLATVALTAPMRSEETIREVISERAAALAVAIEKRFRKFNSSFSESASLYEKTFANFRSRTCSQERHRQNYG